jgi:DeoR family ulaG and ulaABCDEF operon transcriptional repressor
MLERERHRLILKLAEERSVIGVADLADLLDASEATIRRDIISLAERGELKRVRGGAEALTPRHKSHLAGVPFSVNMDKAAPEKRAIAKAAAALVEPGDSIIINGGTTTWRMVEFIKHLDLDVLTNSFPIAAELTLQTRCRITLPGGTIYPEQNIILCPYAESDAADHFAGRIMFSGAFGIGNAGWMETDPLIVQSQRRLLKRAEQVVVLADASKLKIHSSMVVAPLERIDLVITDDGAQEKDLTRLRDAGVEVIVAEVLEADRGLDNAA